MSVTTIPKPGVKVIQQFATVSPTIASPTLPACILGAGFQIVEAVDDTGALDSDALTTVPAKILFPFITTTYTGLSTTTLVFRVNNAAAVTVTFDAGVAGADLTPEEAKADIDAVAIAGIVVTIETSGATKRVVISTLSEGQFASLEITAGTAIPTPLSTMAVGQKTVGRDSYNSFFLFVASLGDYPDPRSNIAELDIDFDTVRGFLDLGGGKFREVLRTETFLRGAVSAVTVVDDGDGDNLSPFIAMAGETFPDQSAILTGTVDWTTLSFPGDFGVLTLFVEIDGTAITVTFSSPATAAAAIVEVNTQLDAGLTGTTAVLNGSNQPVITSPTTGPGSSVEIFGTGTINNATIGLANGLFVDGAPSVARAQGNVDLTSLGYGGGGTFDPAIQVVLGVDGGDFQTIILDTALADAAAVVTAFNAPFVGTIASLNDANELVLVSLATFGGDESTVRVDPNSTALTALGLDTSGAPFETVNVVNGDPYDPLVGDQVIVDGLVIGTITEVASGGNADRLRLDTELLLTFTGTQWIIQAKGLDNVAATALRPSSDLQVDPDNGEIIIKHELTKDAAGTTTAANQLVYVGYNALRLDISPVGTGFNLLRFGDLTTLQNDLKPIDVQNPLGLGLFFAMLNAPGLEVLGVGVADTSDTEPNGTLVAYTAAFEFLESKDVYAIAPMTHDLNVGFVGELHVDEMSDPENAGERVVFLNPDVPTRNANTIVASGATANTPGGVSTMDTQVANLPALLAAAGLGAGPYTITDNIFLELENDTNKYLVTSVSGSIVTVSTGALAGNDDAFYFIGGSPAFAAAIVDRPFSVAIRGAVLANLTEEAIAYAAIAQGFANRRVIVTTPDTAVATIDGLSQQIEGFYIPAALCGLTSSKQPQDPMTNVDVSGFDGLVGATDRYGEAQLKIMDGGGLWSMFQPSDTAPIQTRHQLASDMSTIEKREFSITTAVDFAAKFIRNGLRNFIGRFNITGQVQDSISITLDGLGAFLVSQGVFSSVTVNRIAQSVTQPDKLEIDLTLGVLFPLNELQVRLIV